MLPHLAKNGGYLIAKNAVVFVLFTMKAKHIKTLEGIFKKPTLSSIVFTDIESLVIGLGGQIREGVGSRMVLELRQWFIELGVKP
jgi:hypothetical protein